MTDLPVACTLGPAALKARREGLLAEVFSRAQAIEDLPDGCRLRFAAAGDIVPLLARAVDAERQCCRFLRFQMIVEPDDGPVTLELTGPPGTREFLAGLLEG
jgi:hypothetical protein